MYGEGQFKQVILGGRDMIIHSGIEKGEHDLFLYKRQVLELRIPGRLF